MNTIKVAGTGSLEERIRALEQAVNYGEVVLPFTVVGEVEGGDGGTVGPPGPEGPPGPAGPGVPVNGTDGQVLTKTGTTDYATTWQTPAVVEGVTGVWNYRTADGTGDPGTRNLSPDVATAPTFLRFSKTEVDGTDATNVLVTTDVGDVLIAQQRTDANHWSKAQVRAPIVDHGTWVEVPITVLTNSGAGPPANNTDVEVQFQRGTGTTATLAYRHVQATAATTWSITHNLSFRPNVAAVDSTGREMWPGAVDYPSATAVTLTFSAAVGGEAFLS